MAWVKLDTGIFRNPKVVTVGAEAKLLYIAGICYAGDNLTDGLIPANAIPILAAEANVKNAKRATAELVDAGLWRTLGGKFEIHDYLEHNSRSGDVQAKREAARERMQRNRSQNVRANNERSSQEVRPTKEERREKEEDNPPNPPAGGTGGNPIITIEAPNKTTLKERFESFWEVCPRKVGKDAAWRWWERKRPDDALTAVMVDAMVRASKQPRWQEEEGRFVPHPTTWLNRGGWKDELGPVTSGPPGVTLLPGEIAVETAPGEWELSRGDRKRYLSPHYYGVIWDPEKYVGSDGTKRFRAEVAEAKQRYEQEAA